MDVDLAVGVEVDVVLVGVGDVDLEATVDVDVDVDVDGLTILVGIADDALEKLDAALILLWPDELPDLVSKSKVASRSRPPSRTTTRQRRPQRQRTRGSAAELPDGL